jgi:hypothetical protein
MGQRNNKLEVFVFILLTSLYINQGKILIYISPIVILLIDLPISFIEGSNANKNLDSYRHLMMMKLKGFTMKMTFMSFTYIVKADQVAEIYGLAIMFDIYST